MKPWLLIALLIPFSGCFYGEAPVETASCIQDMCILAEPEPYWQEYRDRFGLEQVLFTHNGTAGAFQVGNGFMVFGDGNSRYGEVESDLYVLDFSVTSLVLFGTGDEESAFTPRIHGDNVLFGVEDTSRPGLDRFSLWLWNLENRTKWKLPIDLEGNKHPGAGFDGEWIVFTNTLRTYRAVELWAYNVDDGRLLQLFQPEPRNRHENGTYETVRKPVLHDGIAYYTVLWLLENGESWTDIFATELETNTTRHVKRLPGIQVNHMDAGSEYLAYSTDEEGWVLSLDSGHVIPMPTHGSRDTWIPTVHGDGVAYRSRDGMLQDLWVFNPETGEEQLLIEGSEEFMPGNTWLHNDELYVFVQVINPQADGPYFSNRIFKMKWSG